MQNVERFLVNFSERQIHLDIRALACRRGTAKSDEFKPVHVYNAASPEMPEPKERKFEAEYSESAQPTHQTAFEDPPFSRKSKCWLISFSCKVKVTDSVSVERLSKKLDKSRFTRKDHQSIVEARFLTKWALHLYLEVSTDEYRESFDVRPRRTEGEMWNAFGIKPMALQLNSALTYFGLKDSDFNYLNAGESHENIQKNVPQFLRR